LKLLFVDEDDTSLSVSSASSLGFTSYNYYWYPSRSSAKVIKVANIKHPIASLDANTISLPKDDTNPYTKGAGKYPNKLYHSVATELAVVRLYS
jgi:hypothetical protein